MFERLDTLFDILDIDGAYDKLVQIVATCSSLASLVGLEQEGKAVSNCWVVKIALAVDRYGIVSSVARPVGGIVAESQQDTTFISVIAASVAPEIVAVELSSSALR